MKKSKVIDMLQRHAIAYQTISVGDGYEIVVTERGGRIFGPFGAENGEGLFWMPECWEDDAEFSEFLQSGRWNIGGDRIWIAPELQFSVTDRTRFWETLNTPQAIDPGAYTLSHSDRKVTLTQSMDLMANVLAQGQMHLELSRTVQPAWNPLKKEHDHEALMRGVKYCGFTHTLTLKGESSEDVVAACWDLLQVKPGGKIYIPMFQPQNGVNYYEPIGELEQLVPSGVILSATGKDRYKVGYKAAAAMGRFGYAGQCDEGKYLLIRNFPNDPSNIYNEEPPLIPDESGFSVHVYNDDGLSGGFTEIECNLLSVGSPAGHATALDRVSTWIYFGGEEELRKIGKRLLGFENM